MQETGDQTLLEETNFCVFCLNFQTFRRFCDFQQTHASKMNIYNAYFCIKLYLDDVKKEVVFCGHIFFYLINSSIQISHFSNPFLGL